MKSKTENECAHIVDVIVPVDKSESSPIDEKGRLRNTKGVSKVGEEPVCNVIPNT